MISYDINNNTIRKVSLTLSTLHSKYDRVFILRYSNGWTISQQLGSSSTHHLSSCRVKTWILGSLLTNLCSVDLDSQVGTKLQKATKLYTPKYSSCRNTQEIGSKQSQEPLKNWLAIAINCSVLPCCHACSFFNIYIF